MATGKKSPAWTRKAGQNPKGGLNAKGRASYKKQTGGTLKHLLDLGTILDEHLSWQGWVHLKARTLILKVSLLGSCYHLEHGVRAHLPMQDQKQEPSVLVIKRRRSNA